MLFLTAVAVMHLSAPQVFITAPLFVSALIEHAAFTPEQAGLVIALESSGKVVGSIALMFLVSRVNWRYTTMGALALLAVCNIASMFIRDYEIFRLVRFVAGLTPGVVVPLAYATVAMTSKPERNFAFLLATFLGYLTVASLVLGPAFSAFGLTGGLTVYTAVGLLGMLCASRMPTTGAAETAQVESDAVQLPWAWRVPALIAMFAYFVSTAGVWAYMAEIGKAGGLTESQVNGALPFAGIAGIAGAGLVMLVAARFGRLLPLSIGLAGGLAALGLLAGGLSLGAFMLSVCLFHLFWNTTHPYLIGAMASFDRGGRMVIYAVVAQMLGVAAGPAIGAKLLAPYGYPGVVSMGVAMLIVCLVLIAPAVLTQRRMSARANQT